MYLKFIENLLEMREEAEKMKGNLVFAINGERFEVSSADPSTTLLEYLRYNTRFKSVKLGCGEGGCGACVVLLSKYDPVLDLVEDFTLSSCLTLLCSVNGCSITTSEGIGNSKDGFHSIHSRMTGFHASQCGFCTPGMCMSLYGALVNADKSDRREPLPGFSKLTVSEAERAVAGNLCRCTGYRPIVDVCKSFATDVDMEDLGFNSFWKKGETKDLVERLPPYMRDHRISEFPEFLKNEIKTTMVLDPEKYHWFSPANVLELQRLLEANEKCNGNSVKLIVGNTATGYYKEQEHYDTYIDIRQIPELSMVKRDQEGIEIGAAVTITKAIEVLKEGNNVPCEEYRERIFGKIASHMEKIANGFVRNTGSVGGNIVMAQRKQFPSDIATILLAVGTMVNLMNGQRYEKITLEEFLERPSLESNSVLLSVKIPFREPPSDSDAVLLFETYRAAPRHLGSALAYLNAAFLAEISSCESSGVITVNNCRLAFGAYGTKHAIRARKVEELLTGKVMSESVLHEALKLLRDVIVPSDGTANPAYKSSLAVAFLFEFFGPLTHIKVGIDGYISYSQLDDLKTKQKDGQVSSPALISSAQQVFESKDYNPVGQAIVKSGASLQASGEAVYVDDIPSPTNCLYGAFIYSTKPLARVKSISFEEDMTPVGFYALISYKDIPKGGENVGSKTMFGTEPLFADELTHSAGQRVALVVADTQKHADTAANLAVIAYDTENLDPPILSVEEAVEKSSFFEVPSYLYPKQVGDTSKGMAEADCKILSSEMRLGSQYYFYLETQSALAIPDEDNCMVVHTSNQAPEYTHTAVAVCLGVPAHNIRVITRRVGGGFGGKSMRAMGVATACALAAHKLQRPVRIYMNRKTDMIMAGGRHPMKITYSVGFKSNGKITALQLEILVDAGFAADISPVMPLNIMGTLKKYDWGALSFDMKVCKTNLPNRSAMRGPGDVQGSFIAEAIIEHVASTLSIDVDAVRSINLHTYDTIQAFYGTSAGEALEYTLPSIWDKVAVSSSFKKRAEMIKEFNKCNIWCKRGISRMPITYNLMLRATPGKVSIFSDGSVVVEVGGVELGQGLWTKAKQMAAYGLGLVQCDGSDKLLEKVRVIQSDTLSLIQGGFTAGSTTSETSCEAVRLCCNTLVERLTALKDSLTGPLNWETLILQAYAQSVNLSASTLFKPDYASMQYLNYGAAVSEVEVNLMTGETTILQTDIIYDCGQSLNPAVDLGQIEGAFVQGIGFFLHEEYRTNSDGLVVTDSTWTYKIPTLDTIPRQFNVEVLNTGHNKKRILSSKASGEPPLLLAASVHCAIRAAIREARKQKLSWSNNTDELDSPFRLPVPATMPVVKELCGLDIVERYLEQKMRQK